MAVPAKQISRIISAPIRVAGFSASGASIVVTTAITTALSTAGDNGISVPVQTSPNVSSVGIIASVPNNRIEIYDSASQHKIQLASGDDVYGRLTVATGVYTLSFYSYPSGTETAYTFPAAQNIDFEFNYRFAFAQFPTDAIVGVTTRNLAQDNNPNGNLARLFSEMLTVTATNTISSVTKTPSDTTVFWLEINNLIYDTFGSSSAYYSVNASTKALTWSSINAGFNVETTDRVIARYLTTS